MSFIASEALDKCRFISIEKGLRSPMKKRFNNHRSNDLHCLVYSLWRYFYPPFLSPALNSAVNIIYFWESPDRMECEQEQHHLAPQILGTWGHKGWPAVRGAGLASSNSWPPHELVECQLVGCRETKDPGLTSFVKVFHRSLFVAAAVWSEK